MNALEKIIIIPVLFLAFGLFLLGFTASGFILGMCVALYLGSSTGHRRAQTPRKFPMPNGNWRVVYKERRVPVLCSSFARDNVMRFMAGGSPEVELKRDPTQQFPRGISVYGHWMDPSGGSRRRKLGHIPHRYAKRILGENAENPVCLLSAKVSQVFVPAQHKRFAGFALDIVLLQALDAGSRTCPSFGQIPIVERSMSIGTRGLLDDVCA